jgi:hypothetical protein
MFDLPKTTIVDRVIAKSAFDSYTNTKQKRLFIDLVDKIQWTNKLSVNTINLEGLDIKELQIFEVQLREKKNIAELLAIIDKAIPYHIIFLLKYGGEVMVSTSKKHAHPSNENNAVIDWTFNSEWMTEVPYTLNLKQDINFIYTDFCKQLSDVAESKVQSLNELIQRKEKIVTLQKQIEQLKAKVKNCKQFNIKVELNLKLQGKIKELEFILPK